MNSAGLFNLKGKSAIITASANGIGKATALLLAKRGANISMGNFYFKVAKTEALRVNQLPCLAIF